MMEFVWKFLHGSVRLKKLIKSLSGNLQISFDIIII